MAYQRAYFPMKNIKISQGYGVGTHKNSYALDLSGKDGGRDEVFAPFDCKVTKLYQPKDTKNHAPTVWLTSTKKVLSPNGYYGYLTVSLTHASEIMKMKIGQTFKQFSVVCKENKLGNATGNHIHLEVSKGTKAGWQVIKGSYVNINKVKPEEYLFVKDDSIILSSKPAKGNCGSLIKEKNITYKVKNVPSEPLNIRNKPVVLSKKIGELKNGDEVIKFYDKGNWSYIYHYEKVGWIVSKYLQKK